MNVRDLIPWNRPNEARLNLFQPDEGGPFASFHREMNRLFDEALRGMDVPRETMGMMSGNWPRVETSENDQEIRISAELPGMDEKDVELSINDNVLTLRGEKKKEVEDKERGYSERFHGRFERRLTLPKGIMEDKCVADFKNGVLTIHLPKSAEAQSRVKRIPISAETTTH